jgi:hypothetical protein
VNELEEGIEKGEEKGENDESNDGEIEKSEWEIKANEKK